MSLNNIVVPIQQKEIYGGFAKLTGLARASENYFIVEYQVQDELFGWFDSNIIEISIPFHLIRNITVEENWFSNKLTIHFNKLPKLKKPLKVRGNTLSFNFKKSNLEDAKKLRSRLMISISEQKLEAMGQDSDMDDELESMKNSDESVKIQDMGDPEESSDNSEEASGASNSIKNMLKNK